MHIILRILAVLVFSIPASTVKLPSEMSQAIFCESCSAVMKELNKLLAKKSSDPRELHVIEAMENICQAKYFSTYLYSPPTTIKACRFLLENYEEEIEQLLTKNSKDSETNVCYKMTKACEGVDRTKKEKEDLKFKYNNQEQKLTTGGAPQQNDDGIQRMNVDINDPGAAKRLAEQIKQQVGQGGFGAGGGNDDDDEEDEEEEEEEEEEEDDDSKDTESDGEKKEDGTKLPREKTEL
ncbi:uncharacterized protein [Montipora capricornis]|uniref:uncharacterized protein n=1 Tax=Montipora capricornis TaxID=246305 RepID=UPI0035F1EEC2